MILLRDFCIATGYTVEETTQRMKQAIEFPIEGLKVEVVAFG